MVTLGILPIVPLVGNGTICNPERFSAANGTTDANATINGNVGTNGTYSSPLVLPMVPLVSPTVSTVCNIMINTSNLFSYSYFLCVHFSISIIC